MDTSKTTAKSYVVSQKLKPNEAALIVKAVRDYDRLKQVEKLAGEFIKLVRRYLDASCPLGWDTQLDDKARALKARLVETPKEKGA